MHMLKDLYAPTGYVHTVKHESLHMLGKDLTGEIAKSQAFLVFKSSYEFAATVFEDLLVPDAFP